MLEHRWMIILPAIVLFAFSTVFAVLGPKRWRATQVFHLRDEMIGRQHRPGHFESLDDMKTAQETILEIARNPDVVRRVLQELNPAKPTTNAAIEDAQSAIQVSSSNGAELGETELIRLSVLDRTPDRAREFCRQLTSETEKELRTVRYNRARSMTAELSKATESAENSLREIAAQIADFETALGPNLSDLRNLIEPTSGDNQLKKDLNQINIELRGAQVSLESLQQQKRLLQSSYDDVHSIVATPNELLDLQPALRRLKDGLVDAQLKLAGLQGEYHDNHPKVVNALEGVERMKQALRDELGLALRGLEDQIQVTESNVAKWTQLAADTNARLQTLTEQRVVYDQMNEEFKRRDVVLRDAQTALAQADSIKEAARSVDLLTRVSEIQVASRPEGISKRTLVGTTSLLGLVIGLGLVVLFHSPPPLLRNPVVDASAPRADVATAPSITSDPVARPIVHPTVESRPAAAKSVSPESMDQILDRGSFAVTVVPASFLISNRNAE